MSHGCVVLVKMISEGINERLSEALSARGLTLTELRFMRYAVIVGRPVRMRELEEYYGYAFPTVAGAIKALERRGMVELIPDDSDRRVKLITVAPAGLEAVMAIEDLREELDERLMSGLDDSEREMLSSILHRIIGNVRSKVAEVDISQIR